MISSAPQEKKTKSKIIDTYSFRYGGLELLDEIEEMWEKLNKHHFDISPFFKEHFSGMSFDKRKQGIIQKSKNHWLRISICMSESNEKLGYCLSSFNSNAGELESLYVEERYRGKGIGRFLADDAFQWFRKHDVREIAVEVAFGNEKAHAFYSKYGLFPRATKLTNYTITKAAVIGLEKGTVKLFDSNPEWADCFNSEKAIIINALEPSSISVEHVGSTSIAELCAKPIIDILIGIDSFETGFKFVPGLEAIGYEFKGENGIQFRHFFAKGNPRTHHVHMVAKDSTFWKEHLLFRDYLMRNKYARDAYAELKIEMASKYPNDREKYTDAKAEFIQSIIAKAKSEEGGAEKDGL